MNTPAALLARLNDLARSLAGRESALALLGLGSIGRNLTRLDEFSDLDFFLVVREGTKRVYLENLDWMEVVHPVAWAFQNTADGHKLLFADGIFCEYAVFEPSEMADAHHPGGRLVWHRKDFDTALCAPRHLPSPPAPPDPEWVAGEALSNLYVGVARYLRGEKWGAAQFVQDYAVHRAAELLALAAWEAESKAGGSRDPYGIERRFEARHPGAEAVLSRCMQGYDRTPESALEILAVLRRHVAVNEHIAKEIEGLCRRAIAAR